MAHVDYPLLLTPHYAERVWGGDRLGAGIGEAWDLSVHRNGPSTVANGPLQGRSLADVSVAAPHDFGGPIDLLAKRLDCARDLSIQVHPKTGETKTEAWVVLDAEEGAGVYHGWSAPVDAATIRAAAIDGSLPSLLRFVPVRTGQCVFVPSGTVHAIGGGLFLFELQQSNDTTYRLYDWGRGRELHLDAGLAHADLVSVEAFRSPKPRPEGALRLVECEHFFIDRLDTHKPHAIDPGERWVALLVLEGSAHLAGLDLARGSTVLIPRAAGSQALAPDDACSLLLYGPC